MGYIDVLWVIGLISFYLINLKKNKLNKNHKVVNINDECEQVNIVGLHISDPVQDNRSHEHDPLNHTIHDDCTSNNKSLIEDDILVINNLQSGNELDCGLWGLTAVIIVLFSILGF